MSTALSLHLRDLGQPLVAAWQRAFAGVAAVTISRGDIFSDADGPVADGAPIDVVADAVVSPANSFGFMDGGIDAQLPTLVAAVRRGFEIDALNKLTEARLYVLTLVDALDLDTLQLFGMLGGDAGQGALPQVDLLGVLPAASVTATWRPWVAEPGRISTATSYTSPSSTLTSLPCGLRCWACNPRRMGPTDRE